MKNYKTTIMSRKDDAIDYDVAHSIINHMFVMAMKALDATDDPQERERLDKDIEMYRWELAQLNRKDENAYRSVVDKAFNQYGPILKARMSGEKK